MVKSRADGRLQAATRRAHRNSTITIYRRLVREQIPGTMNGYSGMSEYFSYNALGSIDLSKEDFTDRVTADAPAHAAVEFVDPNSRNALDAQDRSSMNYEKTPPPAVRKTEGPSHQL